MKKKMRGEAFHDKKFKCVSVTFTNTTNKKFDFTYYSYTTKIYVYIPISSLFYHTISLCDQNFVILLT